MDVCDNNRGGSFVLYCIDSRIPISKSNAYLSFLVSFVE